MRSRIEVIGMGMLDRFGRIADTYISERDQLLEADEERRRVFVGHAFWPTEIIRDSIILAAMMAVISFYSWIIPPSPPQCSRPVRPSRLRIPRLVCPVLIRLSEMGRVPSTVHHSRGADWGLLWHSCNRLERRLVGLGPNRHPRWPAGTASVHHRKEREEGCRRSLVRHCRSNLSGSCVVHLSILNQHLPRSLLEGSEKLLLVGLSQLPVLRPAGLLDC